MGNLIYVLIIIVYIIFQIQQARVRKQKQEEAGKRADSPEDPGQKEIPQPSSTPEERMKEIFRQIEMKTNPYARPIKSPAAEKKRTTTQYQSPQKPIVAPPKKKPPVPFLTVDMTEEEVLPEGTPSKLSEDAFTKHQISNFDYNAVEKKSVAKFNLRNAMIGKIIFDRPEW